MKKAIALATVLIAVCGIAQAEERFKTSANIGLANCYFGGILGIRLGDCGAYIQPSVRIDDSTTGLFGSIWATNGHGFDHEIDLTVGWKGRVTKTTTVQIDYSVFYYTIEGQTNDIENLRMFWNKPLSDDWKVYGAFQQFLPGDFGPGAGLAYTAGVGYKQVSVQFGGHDGLFNLPSDQFSFGRVSYSSKPLPVLKGGVLNSSVQYGDSPIVPGNVIVGMSWSF